MRLERGSSHTAVRRANHLATETCEGRHDYEDCQRDGVVNAIACRPLLPFKTWEVADILKHDTLFAVGFCLLPVANGFALVVAAAHWFKDVIGILILFERQ